MLVFSDVLLFGKGKGSETGKNVSCTLLVYIRALSPRMKVSFICMKCIKIGEKIPTIISHVCCTLINSRNTYKLCTAIRAIFRV